MATIITVAGNKFIIKCEYFNNQRVKDLPDRKYNPTFKHWEAPINKTNAICINNTYRAKEVMPDAQTAIEEIVTALPQNTAPFPSEFIYRTKPLAHQAIALRMAWPLNEFDLSMDMGTGKTWVAISLAGLRFETKQISALMVVCPSSIKPVWLDELEEHHSVEYEAHIHEAGGNRGTLAFLEKECDKLKVLIIGVEALSQGQAWIFLREFCVRNDTMMVIDESTSIKTPPKHKGSQIKPNRTSRCWDAGEKCKYRLIMTGTPITQGIQDLFAQFRFLNWEIIGNRNYFSFKSRYTVSGGFEGKRIIGYKNLDELMDRVRPYVYSVRITDVMDMPEQVYEQRLCEMNDTQKRLLKELGNPFDMSTAMDDLEISCDTVLERMARYQQIVGGHFPFKLKDEKGYGVKVIPGRISKLDELLFIIESTDEERKICIWARFYPEQKLIIETLGKKYPPDASVWFKGGLKTDERRTMIHRFRNDPSCRFFVSGGAGYRGLTLIESNLNVNYSNTFSYDDRAQKERRTWRKGQEKTTVYVDLTANHKIDKNILTVLKKKQDLAHFVDSELRKLAGE